MSVMTVLLTLACTSSGTVALGDGSGDGGDGGGGEDTGEVLPDPNIGAGEYEGFVTWAVPDADWTICDMNIELSVDDEGVFELEDACVYESRDGTDYDLDIVIEGSVNDDGEVDGEIRFVSWAIEGWGDYYLQDYSADLEGELDGDEIILDFETEANFGNNGEYAMPGVIEIER